MEKKINEELSKINEAILPGTFLEKVKKNVDVNYVISDYYLRYAREETRTSKQLMFFYDRADRVQNCNKFWSLDKYERNKIKNLKRTYLCRDKFCANCKKVKQSIRSAKYLDSLYKYDDDLYFLTLTVPNASDSNLKSCVNNILKSFSKFIKYLNGEIKVKGIDFKKFGYLGAVRSLEITYKKKEEKRNRFHPHIHAAIILKNYNSPKSYIHNRYSEGHENIRLFTQDEILIQKLWFLIVNNIKVTKENLQYYDSKKVNKSSIKKTVKKKNPGYSCTLDKFKPGQYAEVFKYMIKDKDQDGDVMDYETFRCLLHSLNGVRQLQGYGVLYNCKDIEKEEFENIANKKVKDFLVILDSLENKKEVEEDINKICKEQDYTVISEKKLVNAVKIQSLKTKNNIIFSNEEFQDDKLSQEEIKFFISLGKEEKKFSDEKEKIRAAIMNKANELYKKEDIIKNIDSYVRIVMFICEKRHLDFWKVINMLGIFKEGIKNEDEFK